LALRKNCLIGFHNKRHTEQYKATFTTNTGKTGIKIKGTVAAQRKLLEMTYTIYKTKKAFDIEYLQKETRWKQDGNKILRTHNK